MIPTQDLNLFRKVDALVDDHLATRGGLGRLTLDPDRDQASSFEDLATKLIHRHEWASFGPILSDGLMALMRAQIQAFPENLLWDYDALVFATLVEARTAESPSEILRERYQQISDLYRLYGRQTEIHFRYIHDFIYGFDWAKWLRKQARQDGEATYEAHLPFGPEFLTYLHKRAEELRGLIDENDEEYPQLPAGQDRNPFGFDRRPEAELSLHRELAKRGQIPVLAWRGHAVDVAKLPAPSQLSYAQMRKNCADELGWGF